ncbi:PREDICTED: prostatic acid phosphatase-like [Ceratosolen solmsi marchali]|uniref:acid phosphatase n=1 Tax=Ceratosolen solmsi marchali TaxID=326594 RepID=A0AAJ6YJQ0_9HYME|nr:PREDICTED: prostatic acid phosphatase-like [Ceratosolen solmsi marchali]
MFQIFTFWILITYATSFILQPNDYKVELVQAIFRHGDRTPTIYPTYPTDPYNASFYEPYGIGQLTNKGKQRAYMIGAMLKKRYADFLGEIYKPDYVYAYSRDLDRNKMTLQLVLAGIFPPTLQLTWNEKIYWMPHPMYINPNAFDFLSVIMKCSAYGKLWHQVINSSEIQKKLKSHKDFLTYISKSSGFPTDFSTAIKLYSIIRSQMSLDLPLPDWCTNEVFEKLEELMTLQYSMLTYTNDMKKFVAGPIIKRFLNNLKSHKSKDNNKKIYLYSANDYSIAAFAQAHNFTVPIVDYGCTIIFEKLRGRDNQIYVRVRVFAY